MDPVSPALAYAACELIVGALFMLAVVAWDHYHDTKKKKGPWGR